MASSLANHWRKCMGIEPILLSLFLFEIKQLSFLLFSIGDSLGTIPIILQCFGGHRKVSEGGARILVTEHMLDDLEVHPGVNRLTSA